MEQFQAVVENRTGFCLDPRTKLLLMAVVATAEFLYSHTAFMIAVAMIPFVLLLLTGSIRRQRCSSACSRRGCLYRPSRTPSSFP